MEYRDVVRGRFLSRPNRFIALVELDGAETVCHVKNTGRCRELLIPGAWVYLTPGAAPGRRRWQTPAGEICFSLEAANQTSGIRQYITATASRYTRFQRGAGLL